MLSNTRYIKLLTKISHQHMMNNWMPRKHVRIVIWVHTIHSRNVITVNWRRQTFSPLLHLRIPRHFPQVWHHHHHWPAMNFFDKTDSTLQYTYSFSCTVYITFLALFTQFLFVRLIIHSWPTMWLKWMTRGGLDHSHAEFALLAHSRPWISTGPPSVAVLTIKYSKHGYLNSLQQEQPMQVT